MAMTMTEAANKLGVSRQYVSKLLKQLPIEAQPKRNGRSVSIDDKTYRLLSNKLGEHATKTQQTKETGTQPNAQQVTDELRDDYIERLKHELDERNKQIAELTKSLQNEQQLRLVADKRVDDMQKQLQAPEPEDKTPEDEPVETVNEPVSDKISKEKTTTKKKKWWQLW